MPLSSQWNLTEFRRVLDHLPDGVVLHREGLVRYANRAAAAMLGVPDPSDLLDRQVLDFVHPEDRALVRARITESLSENRPAPLQIERLLRPDGSVLQAEVASIPFETPKGRALLVVARDVTHRELLVSHAEAAHRAEALLTLVEGLGHLLGNPLTGLVDRLARALEALEVPGSPQAQRLSALLQEASEEARRIQEALHTVRQVTRPEHAPAEPMPLARAARTAVELLTPRLSGGVRLALELEEPAMVRGNLGQLTEVVAQILLNAVQAAERSRRPGTRVVRLLTSASSREVSLLVADDADGIPPTLLPRIFDPFVTTATDGRLGLGLSRARRVVEAHGGRFHIDSDASGTRVHIHLPRLPEASSTATRPHPEQAPTRQARVLVVDDEPLVTRTFERLLSPSHQVESCADGRQALHRVQEGGRYDILFVDIVMPEIDGIELYRRLLADFPDQAERVVFVTGGAFSDGAARFLDEVDRPVLYKPFDLATIRHLVDEATAFNP